jgi:predicted 3-demethylubiquinone-9 3-methyltransferase (glyoxalase superfamily)
MNPFDHTQGKQKIVPHLWYNTQAKAAAEFYATVFPSSKVTAVTQLHDTPSGDVDLVTFEIMGYKFTAISAGLEFIINPSISFMVNFDPSQIENAREKIDEVWNKLAEGGKVLMEIGEYPFSKRYGWVQDKFGVSWQLIFTNPEGEDRPLIMPFLLIVSETGDKAEEATDFYISVFKNANRGSLARYTADMEPNKEGAIIFTDYKLEGQWFAAEDGSSVMHNFAFNEGVSFIINCKDQEEIDHYWEKLSAVPENEQCGWLKDKYGVSWQIVPTAMDEMMSKGTPEQISRVTHAFLKMKKFSIAELENVYRDAKL